MDSNNNVSPESSAKKQDNKPRGGIPWLTHCSPPTRAAISKILIAICLFAMLIVSARLDLDQRGLSYLDRTFIKATASFALARGLNGFISIIQDSDFSVSLGLGGNIAVGEALDPINDLVEQFSLVMLASTTSLGIQKVLLELGTWLGWKLFLVSVVVIMLGIWLPYKAILSRVGYKILIFAVVLRMAIPITATVGAFISQQDFLQKKYETATEIISQVQEELQTEEQGTAEGTATPEQPWYEKYNPSNIIAKMKDNIARTMDQITNLTKYIVDLIVVFVFETILLPLATLWGLVKLLGAFIGHPSLLKATL